MHLYCVFNYNYIYICVYTDIHTCTYMHAYTYIFTERAFTYKMNVKKSQDIDKDDIHMYI